MTEVKSDYTVGFNMGEQIKQMMDMLENLQKSMEVNQESINARLDSLEASSSTKDEPRQQENLDPLGTTPPVRQIEVMAGREKQITKTFGEDTSADALLEFLEQYRLIVEINQQKSVPGWEDASYRAKELRCQLQGEAATYVRQEEAMHEIWVNDDEKIVEKLRARWISRDCIELDIIEFEEARQGDMETLAQFMTRLKGLGQRAFGEFDPRGMQQRIIWRFLDGVKDKDVRSSIIKERWMVDRKTPKSYDEVLKIGENALMVKIAAKATGSLGSSTPKSTVGIASVTSERNNPGHGRGRGNRGRGGGSTRGPPKGPPKGVECFYCGERHPGGWKSCDKKHRKNPTWTPQHKSSRSSAGSSSNPRTPEDRSPISTDSSNRSFQ